LETSDDVELAESVSEQILLIERYVSQNIEGFRKILKKYRKKSGRSTVW
jgi:hypothetical protein